MVSRVKIFSYVFASLFIALIGFKVYFYFTHNVPPKFQLEGLFDSKTYQSEVNCTLKASNSYKVANMSFALDGKPFDLNDIKKIGSSKFEIPFKLDTRDLAEGKHTLLVKATDGSFNANESIQTLDFFVDNKPLKAALLQSEYKIDQGRTIHVRINANKEMEKVVVSFISKIYECFPESEGSIVYECFIPLDCEEESAEHKITALLEDKVGNSLNLSGKVTINAYPFKKAVGFVVDREKLKQEEEVSISDKVLKDALEKWVKDSPKQKLWAGRFDLPMNVTRIATPFGEIRTTIEKGKYYHKAVDLVNLPRSVIWASQTGKVIIKDRYSFTGNTVVLDHGRGIHTLYFHLDEFSPGLEVGDLVKKGNPVGRLGKTGYASGYHLHWELRVNNIPVDPMQWIQRSF
ncbi:M23 family metallopeptidase [Candidatus Babeliales bacterium]|nr:M23 family metallopeptidase [Candidatus Babeliales bacterium]